ncbi:MAG: citramalate synthase [bacterium]
MEIDLYDTTLRDGSQAENVAFSLEDKVRITHELDDLGVDYIEGGWPGSNPKDVKYFDRMKEESLDHAKLTAFGSTRHIKHEPQEDPNLNALIEAETPVVTIFGKTWDLHVEEALGVTLEENLEMIESSIRFLKDHGREVIYDAEHYFDAFKNHEEYALKTVKRASEAGADCICLCETNGGRLPNEVRNIVNETRDHIDELIGIHAHNDAACAVANSLEAVRQGAKHVQGTINGFGERCGNADLTSIIPNLQLKMDHEVLSEENLKSLRGTSRFVYELANLVPDHRKPFVGESAFAHKGGIHVSAIRKNPDTYEHIDPELVGNTRRILVSELSGKSNVLQKAEELDLDLGDEDQAREVVEQVKELEDKGYQYEAAEGSFEILVNRMMDRHRVYFSLEGFRVITEQIDRGKSRCEATIKVRTDRHVEHTAADGVGPVNALDNALRKALNEIYPELEEMHLTDYKVRVLDETDGTQAKVRVLIEMQDEDQSWGTVGVSENIIEASWQALTDGIDYKLMKTRD